MMRARDERTRFGRSLVLAFAVSIGLPATVLVLGPLIGRGSAIGLHWVIAGAAWAAWQAPSWRRSLAAGVAALTAGIALIHAVGVGHPAPGMAVVVSIAGVLAVTRSVVPGRVAGPRALSGEIAIGVAAVSMAAWLAGPSLLAAMAGLWGFFLVQCVHGLWPGAEAGRGVDRGPGGFERAAARLTRLLDEA